MTRVEAHCASCGKRFSKELRRANEAKKFGWKYYCSLKCQSLAKNKQKIFKCGNPSCGKTFKRSPHEIPRSGICFCSESCAAIVNNQKSPKRRPKIKKCPACGNQFSGRRKYCSRACQVKLQKITEQEIIKAARVRFGSWNRAIKTAGFEPNPVMFANKHLANDGHKCDSFAEMVIDNWLHQNNILHQVHVRYPQSLMNSDFLINDIRIEFVGLEGESKKYDRFLKRKRNLIKRQNLKVIEIYPEDLFPHNKLSKILTGVIK